MCLCDAPCNARCNAPCNTPCNAGGGLAQAARVALRCRPPLVSSPHLAPRTQCASLHTAPRTPHPATRNPQPATRNPVRPQVLRTHLGGARAAAQRPPAYATTGLEQGPSLGRQGPSLGRQGPKHSLADPTHRLVHYSYVCAPTRLWDSGDTQSATSAAHACAPSPIFGQ